MLFKTFQNVSFCTTNNIMFVHCSVILCPSVSITSSKTKFQTTLHNKQRIDYQSLLFTNWCTMELL